MKSILKILLCLALLGTASLFPVSCTHNQLPNSSVGAERPVHVKLEFAFDVNDLVTNQQFTGQKNTFHVKYAYAGSLQGNEFDPTGHAVDASRYPYFQSVKTELIEFATKYPDKSAFYEIFGESLARDILKKFPQILEIDLWIDVPAWAEVPVDRRIHIVASR